MIAGSVNIIAVLVATLAAWVFDAIWFRVFLTRWMDALGKTREQLLPDGQWRFGAMAVAFVAELVAATVLAYLIPIMGQVSVLTGLMTAGMCWLGFVLTTVVVNTIYARDGLAFVAVASWHWLGVMLVMGGVIGAFG